MLFFGGRDPLLNLLLMLPGMLLALTLHELAHGLVADHLGDPTARYAGRLTLNPLRHLDPLGTILLLVVGFGWAKPVPVDPRNFANRRGGMAAVGLAGPLTNFLLAFVLSFPLVYLQLAAGSALLERMLSFAVIINVLLGIFNLLPVPPLDGSRILPAFLSPRAAYAYELHERWGYVVLLVLLFTGLLGNILVPLVNTTYGSMITTAASILSPFGR
ncbi:MAG: site-2 protease family protein [Thermaerobacter sp.]|nr:site-2 protease family protein [Thermaerobacter sp.]MDA8145109.1 site-2 protease family protein [Thermaerobacter sp.]